MNAVVHAVLNAEPSQVDITRTNVAGRIHPEPGWR
jgi:hypothetical protein